MDLNLHGKTALITGGSHGIGLAIAVSLAKEGCNISFCSREYRYSNIKARNKITEYGVKCEDIKADAAILWDTDMVIRRTLEVFGKIDILINNVGGGSSWGNKSDWIMTTPETWHNVFTQTFNSTVHFTNGVLPYMIENKFGRVVSISSIYGKENGGLPWFQAAKSAQISFMKSYSSNIDFVKNNITFNSVCPGFIDMLDKKLPESLEQIIPMGRFGAPEEISPIVTLLCSEKASYINGACIVVDGGYTKSF